MLAAIDRGLSGLRCAGVRRSTEHRVSGRRATTKARELEVAQKIFGSTRWERPRADRKVRKRAKRRFGRERQISASSTLIVTENS